MYHKTGNEAFVASALKGVFRGYGFNKFNPTMIAGPEVLNPIVESPGVSTNGTAQLSLIAIQVLEMCADKLPVEVPEREDPRPGRKR